MIKNQEGKDLLSNKMLAFGTLFGAFVGSGLDPITAVVFAITVVIILSNVA